MGRNFAKDLVQYPPLDFFEPRFGRFDQPDVAGLLGKNSIVVVPQPGSVFFVGKSFEVGEPFQFGWSDLEPFGQSTHGFD